MVNFIDRVWSGFGDRQQQALKRAERFGYVGRNVVLLTDPPKMRRQPVSFLDGDQLARFLDAARSDRLGALYTLALATGLREGELLGLIWEDVDLERAELHVKYQLQRIEGRLQRVQPKTLRSRRTAILPGEALEALKTWRFRQVEERLASQDWKDTGFVFTSRVGTPLEARNVIRSFKALLRRAGLPSSLRFHDLRHSFASYLISLGVHPREVMEMMGHSQISLTMNVYGHLMPAAQREAAGKLDGLLKKARSAVQG